MVTAEIHALKHVVGTTMVTLKVLKTVWYCLLLKPEPTESPAGQSVGYERERVSPEGIQYFWHWHLKGAAYNQVKKHCR